MSQSQSPHYAPLRRLEKRLHYQFKNPQLLVQAMSHRSMGGAHNERLEFLGDSILGFVVSELLYHRFPHEPEGNLTRLRARLVRGESLAEMARELEFSDALLLGSGELKSGGHRRDSILADAMEAVIGAVFLDSDFVTCQRWLLRLIGKWVEVLPAPDQLKDPKTRLQEQLQAQKLLPPQYEVIRVEGEGHQQQFTSRCTVKAFGIVTEGKSSGRRKAEQIAAEAALKQLEESSALEKKKR